MNRQLIEIASWRIVSELYRRYPGRFRIIETHPGGGMYDCLSLYDTNLVHIANLNRAGRFHVFHRFDDSDTMPEPFDWKEMADVNDPKDTVDRMSTMLGLPIPVHLPADTSETLVYRFIAHFLTHSAFGREVWECRNGFCDTSGYGGGIVEDFDAFPEAKKRLKINLPDDINGEPAYRYWFLRRNGTAVLCLERSGTVWLRDGKHFDLVSLYKREEQHLWQMIISIAGQVLP